MHSKSPQSLYAQSPKLNQLNVLREVAANARITQAELANRCSLSVAMVNNYMKDLCNNDLLEYNRKSIKSVTYHLTPSGARQLESLQSELIHEMARMFLTAKEHIRNRILDQANSALQRIVIYGSDELAQLVFHSCEMSGISILGICDDDTDMIGRDFCGREVVNPSQIRYIAPDAVIVTKSLQSKEILETLAALTQRGIELIRLDIDLQATPLSSQESGSNLHSYYKNRNRQNGAYPEHLTSRS